MTDAAALPAPRKETTPARVIVGHSHLGRKLFRLLTSKRNPVQVDELPQLTLLEAIFNRKIAAGLNEASEGDIRNLSGWSLRDLVGIDGVDEATAGKVAALFGLFTQMVKKAA